MLPGLVQCCYTDLLFTWLLSGRILLSFDIQ